MFYSLQNPVVNETFAYDDLGRLTTFETGMDSMTGANYVHDIFGRLTAKTEADTSIVYDYVDGDGSTYSSYNYGNIFVTHFLIDYLGWKGRGY